MMLVLKSNLCQISEAFRNLTSNSKYALQAQLGTCYFLPKIHRSEALCGKPPAALCPIEPSTGVTWCVINLETFCGVPFSCPTQQFHQGTKW